MKRKTLKSLNLNKKAISNLNVSGGRAELVYPTFQQTECTFCETDISCPTWADSICNFSKGSVCQL